MSYERCRGRSGVFDSFPPSFVVLPPSSLNFVRARKFLEKRAVPEPAHYALKHLLNHERSMGISCSGKKRSDILWSEACRAQVSNAERPYLHCWPTLCASADQSYPSLTRMYFSLPVSVWGEKKLGERRRLDDKNTFCSGGQVKALNSKSR